LAWVAARWRPRPADQAPPRSPRRVGLQAAVAEVVLLGAIYVIPLTKPPPLFAVIGVSIVRLVRLQRQPSGTGGDR